jgi:hypothetical protein
MYWPAQPNPGSLPDQACYRISLAGAVVSCHSGGMLVGDTDCMVRGLTGDTNGNGATNLVDYAQTKSKNGQPVLPANIRFDVNVGGTINLTDAALVKSLNGNSANCPCR